MEYPIIERQTKPNGKSAIWVRFQPGGEAEQVLPHHWIGFDFDGVLSVPDPTKPFSLDELGLPVGQFVDAAKRFLAAGVTVKVFTARACDPDMIPRIQDWTEHNGLGRLEVTNAKGYQALRYYDDRAIQVVWNPQFTKVGLVKDNGGEIV